MTLQNKVDKLDIEEIKAVWYSPDGYFTGGNLKPEVSALIESYSELSQLEELMVRRLNELYNPKPIETQEEIPEELEVIIDNYQPVQTIANHTPKPSYWNPLKKLVAIGTLVAVLATGLVGGYKGGTYLQQKQDDAQHKTQIEQVYENWASDIEQWNVQIPIVKIIVRGAGDTIFDGTYTRNGTSNGQPAYNYGLKWLYFWGAPANKWLLSGGIGVGPPSAAYKSSDRTLPGNPWDTISGAAPAPTLKVIRKSIVTKKDQPR